MKPPVQKISQFWIFLVSTLCAPIQVLSDETPPTQFWVGYSNGYEVSENGVNTGKSCTFSVDANVKNDPKLKKEIPGSVPSLVSYVQKEPRMLPGYLKIFASLKSKSTYYARVTFLKKDWQILLTRGRKISKSPLKSAFDHTYDGLDYWASAEDKDDLRVITLEIQPKKNSNGKISFKNSPSKMIVKFDSEDNPVELQFFGNGSPRYSCLPKSIAASGTLVSFEPDFLTRAATQIAKWRDDFQEPKKQSDLISRLPASEE